MSTAQGTDRGPLAAITGRLSRRGIFTTTDGASAAVSFGHTYAGGANGVPMVKVYATLDGRPYSGIARIGGATVTLSLRTPLAKLRRAQYHQPWKMGDEN